MKKKRLDEAAKLLKNTEDRGAAVTAGGKTLIFTVGGRERKFSSKLAEIDYDNLDAEYKNWGQFHLWYGKLAILAKSRLDAYKSHMDIKLAMLDRAVRQYFEQKGVKATEKLIDHRLKSLPEYRKLYEEFLKRREDLELAQLAKEALERKKDILLQGVTKWKIAEMSAGLSVADTESRKASKKRKSNYEED